MRGPVVHVCMEELVRGGNGRRGIRIVGAWWCGGRYCGRGKR